MCVNVFVFQDGRSVEIDRTGALRQYLGVELVPYIHYGRVYQDSCLCCVDIEASCRRAGRVAARQDDGDYRIEVETP